MCINRLLPRGESIDARSRSIRKRKRRHFALYTKVCEKKIQLKNYTTTNNKRERSDCPRSCGRPSTPERKQNYCARWFDLRRGEGRVEMILSLPRGDNREIRGKAANASLKSLPFGAFFFFSSLASPYRSTLVQSKSLFWFFGTVWLIESRSNCDRSKKTSPRGEINDR